MAFGAQIRAARGPLAGFLAMGVFWGSFAALVPALKDGIGAGDAVFGALLLGGAMAAVGAMLVAPRIGARLGGATLPVLLALYGLAAFVPGLVSGPLGFGLAVIAVGATAGAVDVMMNARLSAIEAARRMPLMNLGHAAYSFTYAGAALAAGAARHAGIDAGLVLCGAAALMLALTAMAVERDARVDGLAPPPRGAAGLGPVPLIAGLVILVGFLAEHSAEAWSALHIERTLGGSAAEGALGPALLGLTMGLGRLFGQAVSARVPERRLMRWAPWMVVAACASLGWLVLA
jgi:hypothetical protein